MFDRTIFCSATGCRARSYPSREVYILYLNIYEIKKVKLIQFIFRFPKVHLVQGYGMTETTSCSIAPLHDKAWRFIYIHRRVHIFFHRSDALHAVQLLFVSLSSPIYFYLFNYYSHYNSLVRDKKKIRLYRKRILKVFRFSLSLFPVPLLPSIFLLFIFYYLDSWQKKRVLVIGYKAESPTNTN